MTFGEIVRAIRERTLDADGRPLSQRAVADAGGIPDAARVSQIERDAHVPSIQRARELAVGLGVTLTEIVAEWEGVELRWTKPAKKAVATAQASDGDADVGGNSLTTERGGLPLMLRDIPDLRLFGGIITAWELVPSERRSAFVKHCFAHAMELSDAPQRTGTHPKE